MTTHDALQKELQAEGLSVLNDVPLSTLGSFQLGGPARMVIQSRSSEELRRIRCLLDTYDTPALLIGEGTNILFSDKGWSGVLVRSSGNSVTPTPVQAVEWRVDAAMSLEDLVDWAVEASLSGLEPFVGIPGTVGGAVVGNAGAWGVQIADRLKRVCGWTRDGRTFDVSPDECGFQYRSSRLKEEGSWVSEIVIELTPGDQQKLRSEKSRVLDLRSARHPDWQRQPCIGSFFKNLAPTSSAGRRQAAGWFLEQAGAKECRVGGAAVFEKHANILIKESDSCRACDVAALAALLKAKVKEEQDIELEREVRYLGSFPGEGDYPGFW